MTIGARGWVSVAELIVFIPSAIASTFICSRHGFGRSSGWVYTLVLCIVRIAGAICQLLTYSNQSDGLLTAYIIIDSIGLSPLLLATLGMLSRLIDGINTRHTSALTVKHFRVLQLIISIGLILSIVGGSSASSSNGSFKPPGTSMAAICLYIVGYVGLMLILFYSLVRVKLMLWHERRISLAVLMAAPFILARLAYSTLAVFVHDHHFNIINGSVPIMVCMAVLEEFVVTLIFIFLGFHIPAITPEERGPIASRPWKQTKQGRQHRRGRH